MDNLSAIDQKVLRFVLFNGINVSEREIARQLRLSQATVNYSLKKMVEKKVIHDFIYRVNYDILGISRVWVFFTLKRNCFDIDQLPVVLSKFPEIELVVWLTGDYDFCILMNGKDTHKIYDSIMQIEKALASFIEVSSLVFVAKSFKCHQIILPKNQQRQELDGLSKKIVSFKIKNPQAGLGELSKALKIHRNTASKKLKELFDRKIILKKSVILNPEAANLLGIGFKSMIFFNVAPDKKDDFAEALVQYGEVHELFRISGHHDFLAIIRTRDTDDLFEFHKKILCNPKFNSSVQKTISRIMLKTRNLNYDQMPMLEK